MLLFLKTVVFLVRMCIINVGLESENLMFCSVKIYISTTNALLAEKSLRLMRFVLLKNTQYYESCALTRNGRSGVQQIASFPPIPHRIRRGKFRTRSQYSFQIQLVITFDTRRIKCDNKLIRRSYIRKLFVLVIKYDTMRVKCGNLVVIWDAKCQGKKWIQQQQT